MSYYGSREFNCACMHRYEQHMHQRLMANLRLQQSKRRYVLPTGRWFDVIGSPQILDEDYRLH